MIQYAIDDLVNSGDRDIGVIIGYLSVLIKEALVIVPNLELG